MEAIEADDLTIAAGRSESLVPNVSDGEPIIASTSYYTFKISERTSASLHDSNIVLSGKIYDELMIYKIH